MKPFHSRTALALLWLCLASPLVGCRKSAPAGTGEVARPTAAAAKYFCPMHPTYTSDRPGDCPICNMKLVPMTPGAAATSGGTSGVPGRALVAISPEKQQLIGLRTTLVAKRALTDVITTTGVVQHDETKLARIAPRFAGWVRKLHVNYTGAPVEKGQPLLTVYSPELLSTESDYLLARQQLEQWRGAAKADLVENARRLLDAARRRLELWQVGDEEIRALEERGKPGDELLLRAPVSGHVITKTAIEGKSFMAGETLFEVGSLDTVWVKVALAETDLPQVKLGDTAWINFLQLGNQLFESRVSFINPHLDPQTRRAELRVELTNANHLLRPEMWAEVEIELHLGESLAVPASAVIDTGKRRVAFVMREDHHFEPRELVLGARTTDWWAVEQGLKEGEKVVTRALFLVDSESQLKAAIAGMGGADHP